MFTCLCTKALHLELVSNMTTEAFLAALSRFTARREICSQLFFDNETSFVGPARELKEVYTLLEQEQQETASNLLDNALVYPVSHSSLWWIMEGSDKINEETFLYHNKAKSIHL